MLVYGDLFLFSLKDVASNIAHQLEVDVVQITQDTKGWMMSEKKGELFKNMQCNSCTCFGIG